MILIDSAHTCNIYQIPQTVIYFKLSGANLHHYWVINTIVAGCIVIYQYSIHQLGATPCITSHLLSMYDALLTRHLQLILQKPRIWLTGNDPLIY